MDAALVTVLVMLAGLFIIISLLVFITNPDNKKDSQENI